MPETEHERLFTIAPSLPTDYKGYGIGEVERDEHPDVFYPDCSTSCKWALELDGPLGYDWLVCGKAGAPRCGMLTFEHMAGFGCFESGKHDDGPSLEKELGEAEHLGNLNKKE